MERLPRGHFAHSATPFKASRSLAEALSTSTQGAVAARAGKDDPSAHAPRITARSSGPRRTVSRMAAPTGGVEPLLAPSCRSGVGLRAVCCWEQRVGPGGAASSADELWSSMKSGRRGILADRARQVWGVTGGARSRSLHVSEVCPPFTVGRSFLFASHRTASARQQSKNKANKALRSKTRRRDARACGGEPS